MYAPPNSRTLQSQQIRGHGIGFRGLGSITCLGPKPQENQFKRAEGVVIIPCAAASVMKRQKEVERLRYCRKGGATNFEVKNLPNEPFARRKTDCCGPPLSRSFPRLLVSDVGLRCPIGARDATHKDLASLARLGSRAKSILDDMCFGLGGSSNCQTYAHARSLRYFRRHQHIKRSLLQSKIYHSRTILYEVLGFKAFKSPYGLSTSGKLHMTLPQAAA